MKKQQIMDKRWEITQNQWQLLLTLYGKRVEYGMYFTNQRQDRRQVIEELHQMVKGGILQVHGEKFLISDEYQAILESCTNVKIGCFLENEENCFWVYLDENCVICEPSSLRKNSFIFFRKKREELLSYLMEIEFFPRYQIVNTRECSQNIEYSILEEKNWRLLGINRVEKNITFLNLVTEKPIARMFISKEEGEEYLVWEGKESRGKKTLCQENLNKIWKEIMKDVVGGSGDTCVGAGV